MGVRMLPAAQHCREATGKPPAKRASQRFLKKKDFPVAEGDALLRAAQRAAGVQPG